MSTGDCRIQERAFNLPASHGYWEPNSGLLREQYREVCSFSHRATSPGRSSNSIATQSNITLEVQAAGCLVYLYESKIRLEEVQAQAGERWRVQGEARVNLAGFTVTHGTALLGQRGSWRWDLAWVVGHCVIVLLSPNT